MTPPSPTRCCADLVTPAPTPSQARSAAGVRNLRTTGRGDGRTPLPRRLLPCSGVAAGHPGRRPRQAPEPDPQRLPVAGNAEIGRAHVGTPDTNEQLV